MPPPRPGEMIAERSSFDRIDRRAVLRAFGVLAGGYTLASAAMISACSDGTTAPGASPIAVPPEASSSPGLGAHGLAYNRDGVTVSPLSVTGLTTQPFGSTMLVCVGRGVASAHSRPSDNLGNAYDQADTTHTYSLWPGSGTALYVCPRSRGGLGYQVDVAKLVPADETTLSVVEIVNGGLVRDVKWSEVRAGSTLTSEAVTTTGPAMLVAWWWGDAGVRLDKTAVPDNGFTLVDAILLEGALVQCAVAARRVDAPGTYKVTWVSTPLQGAQLWLAAIQSTA